MKIRIWLASATVIILILLLALTVNHAREKDMVELFSRQQLAHVQNTATRMADIFLQVGKNVALFSHFDPQLKIPSAEIDSNYKIFSSGWENTLNTVVLFDAAGRIKRIYPQDTFPAINLSDHFKALQKKQQQYLGLALTERSRAVNLKQKTDWYLVVGCPLRRQDGKFAGAWMVSFSLAAVVDKYEKQTRDNELGDLWLIDEKQQIIIHPDSAFIGKNIKDLLRNDKEAQIDFSSDKSAYFEAVVRQSDKKQQRSVVAFSPLQAGDKKWILFVVAPYSQVISPVRKTFVYTLFSSLLLILVVVIVGISFAFKEGKNLRVKEEQKRLKEREDWQEKLLREKKTIDGIIEGSPIPSFVINREHKVILWNRACEELTGYPASEMVNTDKHHIPFYSVKRPVIADLIVDRDLEGLSKYYGAKKVKKSEKVLGAYEATDYFENLGGCSRYLYFLASPIYDERGEIIAAIETLQDVSREEELARSLREYAETLQNELAQNIELRREIEELYSYLQTIVKSLPDKIYELDGNGIVNYMSRGLKKEGGRSSREFKGKYFLDFVAPEDKDFVWARWQEAKKGIYKPYEIEAIAKDGKRVNLLITTSPVIGTDRYLVVQRDITEFKNLEKKLYESQKLAALGQFSAGIAHEVRNPLSSIKMSLQILGKRMNPAGNDLKRFKIAEKEVEHLEELVNNVLIFAKPVDPQKVPVDLAKVLEQALAMAEKGIADKHIDVQTKYEEIPMIAADPAMLVDTFLNIIRNAAEAVEDGGIILISLQCPERSNEAVVIRIEDNGCGIDSEDMPHLFNPFFTRKKYGTGLGLSQVKKIIDLHQGTIDITSEKDKGTTVLVTLPVESEKARLAVPLNK
jgi:PAS domain S-box-containing protein